MREIKFRIYADGKIYYKCLVGNTNDMSDDKWTCPMIWLENRKEWVHCDNGVIQQYTGLKDKNGKEIYEGDIVFVTDEADIATICWDEETVMFIIVFDNWFTDFDHLNGEELEVIGNIHDDKELLEGE